MLKLLKHRLAPLSFANFRGFYFAQSFSLIGTWSHELARSWLVLELAGTTTALATLLVSMALPGLLFTLHGGALADRTDVRRLMLITKTILTCSALLLFALVKFGHIQLWMLFCFAFIEGLVNSFDGPAFTAIFSRTLPREHFQQAIAIQSMSFHISRMAGPAVAGVIMAKAGPAYVFLFDALSYIFVIYMISHVHLREIVVAKVEVTKGFTSTLKSLKYFIRDASAKYKLLQFLCSVIIIVPMMNIVFRSYLKKKFQLNSDEFGFLFSAPALGSMLGALYITLSALHKPIRNLIVCIPGLIMALLSLQYAPNPHIASYVLAACGLFLYLNVASLTQSLQLSTEDHYRGRLSAIINLGFGSLGPLLSLPMGFYTDKMGFEPAIRHITLSFAALSFLLAILHHKLWYIGRTQKAVYDEPKV